MKKFAGALALALLLGAPMAYAAELPQETATAKSVASNPVDQFTGKYWMHSQPTNKEAYLFGIESAIDVEYFVNQKLVAAAAKSGKKPIYTLSPFEKGWMEAFKDTDRKQIAAEVDKWYTDHPDQLERPVMDVIWYELIQPRLAAAK